MRAPPCRPPVPAPRSPTTACILATLSLLSSCSLIWPVVQRRQTPGMAVAMLSVPMENVPDFMTLFPIEYRGIFGILPHLGFCPLELTPEMETIYHSSSNDMTIFFQSIRLDSDHLNSSQQPRSLAHICGVSAQCRVPSTHAQTTHRCLFCIYGIHAMTHLPFTCPLLVSSYAVKQLSRA